MAKHQHRVPAIDRASWRGMPTAKYLIGSYLAPFPSNSPDKKRRQDKSDGVLIN